MDRRIIFRIPNGQADYFQNPQWAGGLFSESPTGGLFSEYPIKRRIRIPNDRRNPQFFHYINPIKLHFSFIPIPKNPHPKINTPP
jgi:hypothetical protein